MRNGLLVERPGTPQGKNWPVRRGYKSMKTLRHRKKEHNEVGSPKHLAL